MDKDKQDHDEKDKIYIQDEKGGGNYYILLGDSDRKHLENDKR
jgi:hypothetical protein